MCGDHDAQRYGKLGGSSVATDEDRLIASNKMEGTAVRLPNFLVIGAPRCGTTMLHYSLEQHSEVFVSPNKEPHFFLFDSGGARPSGASEPRFETLKYHSAKTLDEYAALFAMATEDHRAVGKSSPGYFMFPEVAARIKARLPDAKLVAILRQPVEQARSLYIRRSMGNVPDEDPSEAFVAALETGASLPRGQRVGLAITEYGLYHRRLTPFFEHFARSQIKVTLLEDLQRDSDAFFADLFRFLDVDDSFRPDLSQRYNELGAVRSAMLQRILSRSHRIKRLLRSVLPHSTAHHLARLQYRVRSANLRPTQPVSPDLRRELTERFYADDIGALEGLLGRDLSIWRQ